MTIKTCNVEGCTRDHYATGLCGMHYHRRRRTGSTGEADSRINREGPKPCQAAGCSDDSRYAGYCNKHYTRLIRHGDVSVIKRQKSATGVCSASDCNKKVTYTDFCRKHKARFDKYGDPNVTMKAPPGEGERYVAKSGYVQVKRPDHPNVRPNGWLAEHTVVMAEVMGRPLLPGENVHHKNGVKDDNRPENLELWVSMQPSGQRPEDLVTFAHEILNRYSGYVANKNAS
jgi:hypothetical protein